MSSNEMIKRSKQLIEELAKTADQFAKNIVTGSLNANTENDYSKEEGKSFWEQIELQIAEMLSSISGKSNDAMEELGQIQSLFQSGWKTISDTFEHRGRYCQSL